MAGRIGATRPMPMNDTTQANATAKTAFGCRNGLATEPAWVLLNVYSPPYLLVGQGDVALRTGQCVDGGQRRAERRLVLRADPVQDHREPFGPHRPAPGQRVPALVGQAHLDHPPIGGGRLPAG